MCLKSSATMTGVLVTLLPISVAIDEASGNITTVSLRRLLSYTFLERSVTKFRRNLVLNYVDTREVFNKSFYIGMDRIRLIKVRRGFI